MSLTEDLNECERIKEATFNSYQMTAGGDEEGVDTGKIFSFLLGALGYPCNENCTEDKSR